MSIQPYFVASTLAYKHRWTVQPDSPSLAASARNARESKMQEDKHAVKSCQSAVAKFSTVDHAPDIVKSLSRTCIRL